MREIRQAGWNRSLSDVEHAVQACLNALERYEAAFAGVLAEHGATVATDGSSSAAAISSSCTTALTKLDLEPTLALAQARADDVERLLLEQQAVWEDWSTSYARWRQSLDGMPKPQ